MAEKKNLMTYEGLKKLEDELQELKVVKRKEVAEKIKEAREQGDLSENAEYDAAKDEQRDIEARIEEIEKILKNAEVVKDKEVQQFIYDTVNNPNLTKKENMAIQQKYFKIFYNLLFGTDAGPRLYLFFAASDKNSYLELLNI